MSLGSNTVTEVTELRALVNRVRNDGSPTRTREPFTCGDPRNQALKMPRVLSAATDQETGIIDIPTIPMVIDIALKKARREGWNLQNSRRGTFPAYRYVNNVGRRITDQIRQRSMSILIFRQFLASSINWRHARMRLDACHQIDSPTPIDDRTSMPACFCSLAGFQHHCLRPSADF